MLPIHVILCPTDFSERSRSALHLACVLARDYGARLVVLHVAVAPTVVYGEGLVPPDTDLLLQEAQEELNRLEVPNADIRAERRLEQGDPAVETLRVALEIGANLIVMGTHGRTGLGRLLLGSVAEQVMRQAACPVLTIKTPFPEAVLEPRALAKEPVLSSG